MDKFIELVAGVLSSPVETQMFIVAVLALAIVPIVLYIAVAF